MFCSSPMSYIENSDQNKCCFDLCFSLLVSHWATLSLTEATGSMTSELPTSSRVNLYASTACGRNEIRNTNTIPWHHNVHVVHVAVETKNNWRRNGERGEFKRLHKQIISVWSGYALWSTGMSQVYTYTCIRNRELTGTCWYVFHFSLVHCIRVGVDVLRSSWTNTSHQRNQRLPNT